MLPGDAGDAGDAGIDVDNGGIDVDNGDAVDVGTYVDVSLENGDGGFVGVWFMLVGDGIDVKRDEDAWMK